jgi:DNA modification methylase
MNLLRERPMDGEVATTRSSARFDRVTCADNLTLLRSLPRSCCTLIYADPPFNTDRLVKRAQSSSPRFEDRHGGGMAGYLSFLRPRLATMVEVLAPDGTLYIHLDWRCVHYVKLLLDELLSPAHFLNEVIWSYRSGGRPGRWFARKHDTILVYAKEPGRQVFNRLRDGVYRTRDMCRDEEGRPYKSTRNGRIYFHPEGPALSDVWDIPVLSTVGRQRTGYPTQKPEALLDRIIRASSNKGDLVGDFFCGSGTTLAVAKRLGRSWIGCDENPDAVAITERRLEAISP